MYVPVTLPLLIHVQQRQMITFRYEKLLPRSVALLLSLFWPVKDRWHRQHRDDRQHLGGTLVFGGRDEHLG